MKLKIYLSFIFMVLITVSMQAKKVEVDKAEKLAQNFIQSKRQLRSGTTTTLNLKYTATSAVIASKAKQSSATNEQDTVYYYVFNVNEANKGGFVIVSGDDAVKPILGYSDKGSYDENNLPPNFAWWMDEYQRQITYAQSHNLLQSETMKKEWDSYGTISTSTNAVEPLIKTQWDQGSPYNNLCPVIDGMPTLTGCVATAMAQIMKYWNYPVSGSGKSDAYHDSYSSGIDIPSVSFEVNYDWADILNVYDGSETSQQQNAVATLMYHCGVSLGMGYTPFASATSSTAIYDAMTNHFGYDRNMQLKNRNDYLGVPAFSDVDWENMLRTQIDEGLPIYYVGEGTGSHAFICDGYDNNGNFHFNWGGSGNYDGYYVTSALTPGPSDYSSNQSVFIDIKPIQGELKELNVSAGTLSPTFRPYIFDYTLNVDASVSSIDIKGITDISGATIIGNVTGLPLKLNDFTDVAIQVILPDGSSQIYKINVIRGNIPYPDPSFTWTIDSTAQQVLLWVGVVPNNVLYVDWGDGTQPDKITENNTGFGLTFESINGYKIWHTYNSAGKYQVTLYGVNEQSCPLLNLLLNQSESTYCGIPPINPYVHVTQIDVRKASQLNGLLVEKIEVPSLDVSRNTNLTTLSCNNMSLSQLDVSNNRKLMALECNQNQLTDFDVSKNTDLRILNCNQNQISNLDVTNHPALTQLWCESNQLTNLDISGDNSLTDLQCMDNQLTSLDLSKKSTLMDLICANNQLINLDVSNNTMLTRLTCVNNQLLNLDVSNNTALTVLGCDFNHLSNLDVSHNTALTSLSCSDNQLTNLDVRKNTMLTAMNCGSNQLTNLNVNNNVALTELQCAANPITTLDISHNKVLTFLNCNTNQLSKLDISYNLALTFLDCNSNALPLINLYTLAQRPDITTKYLSRQNLPDSTISVNTSIAIDTVFYGVNTTCNYSLNNGKVTFSTPGDYMVTLSNPALLDGSVQQTFHVVQSLTGLNNIPQDKPLVAWIQNENLHVSGLTAGKPWSVCNASGVVVHQSIANSEEADISLYARGVYFVQSGKQVIKVVY